MSIPDAPWIREAEINGMPGGEDPEPTCPICGRVCDDLYLVDGDVVGCGWCVTTVDAAEWLDQHREEREE